MKYEQAEQFILSLTNIPRKGYIAQKKDRGIHMKRLQYFLDIIGNPEKKIPHYIHVTGTSGKGSVCAYLHSIINESGKKVGSTQSPHPTHMVERWKIGDKIMSKKEFVKIVKEIKPKLNDYIKKSPYEMIYYLDLMTAISLLYFAKQKVKWVILEVGCGGRYDATNIIPYKDAAIITNISIDHQNLIGSTKEKIAYEKAGIIKSGSEVFTSEKNNKILNIINAECKKRSCSMHHIKYDNKQLTINDYGLNGSVFTYKNNKYKIKTPGRHQISNAILAIEATQKLNFSKNSIKKGLEKTKQPLRLETVSKKPMIILDGAHNQAKIKSTVDTLKHLNKKMPKQKNVHLIIGFADNKEWGKMIKLLAELNPKTVVCTKNTINQLRKVANPKNIALKCKKIMPKTKTKIFLDPQDALNWSRKKVNKNDIILITGSISLSGQLRPYLT